MSIADSMLMEFDHEMANTRKVLERVPEDRFDWAPHEKSMKLGRLTSHLATLPTWAAETLNNDELDLAPPGQTPQPSPSYDTRQKALDAFDKNVADARAAIASATDERMMGPWSLLMGGQKLFTLPRAAVLRSFVMNHNIHHRAQLGVYLRMNDVPVPQTFGPTADERM